MYSLKYGTVPIVRATGGLDDTIEPFDISTGGGTGFKFYDYNGEAMLSTIKAALALFKDQASSNWQKLMKNGMAQDYSWGVSAKEYVRVYERARQARGVSA
jgi:starch synthase